MVKFRYGTMGIVLFATGLFLLLVAMMLPALFCHAKARYKGEWSLPSHYPDGFDGYGYLDRVDEKQVVIRDMAIKLSAGVTYHTPYLKNASRAWFRQGSFVGYLTNSNREVTSLWLLDNWKGKRR